MTTEEILYEVSDRIATITLDRPDKLNAWTATMEREVRAAIDAAESDPNARVIILTGAGRGFCAGADMSVLSSIAGQGVDAHVLQQALGSNAAARENIRPDFQRKYSYFPAVTKPVIAAINGPVVGLGLVIALYCDLRFASDAARFGTAFSRRGLIAEYGLAWLLPRVVGLPNALDLLFSARMLDAAEAHRIGLANAVFPQDVFQAKVREYARDVAVNVSPRSMRIMKKQVYEGMFQTLAEAFDIAEREMLESLQCQDFKEGVAHFVEKRAPNFIGK